MFQLNDARTTTRTYSPLFRWFVIGLAFWSAIVVSYGAYRSTLCNIDLHLRWTEIQYVINGINPFDAQRGSPKLIKEIGPSEWVYPPWSYTQGLLIVSPLPYSRAVWYFNTVILFCFMYIAVHLFRFGRGLQGSALDGIASVSMVLGIAGVFTTLKYGNYSIFVFAMLLATNALHCAEKKPARDTLLMGLAFGFAFIKPQMAALFGLYLLMRRAWGALAVAALVVGCCAFATGFMVSESPFVMVEQTAVRLVAQPSYNFGLLDPLKYLVPLKAIQPAGMLLGIAAVVYLLWRYRALPEGSFALISIPAVWNTLWGYNNKNDWIAVGFLLLGMFELLRTERLADDEKSRLWQWFLVVGVSLWFVVLIEPPLGVFRSAEQFVLRILWLSALLKTLSLHEKALSRPSMAGKRAD